LFAAVQSHPNDTVTSIADNLARQYGWNPVERAFHLRRLYDIRRTAAATVIQGRLMVPIVHTNDSVHTFFQSYEQQYELARRQWNEDEEQ
jgi:hypothetical protein